MAPKRIPHELDDEPSIAASLEDFESSDQQHSPTFQLPSQHSGFRSDSIAGDFDSELASSDSTGPWQPPAWHRPSSGWFQQQDHPTPRKKNKPSRSLVHSRETSPLSDADITSPTQVPLPGSPEKRRSPSRSQSPEHEAGEQQLTTKHDTQIQKVENNPQTQNNNFLRFRFGMEVQQRTEPIETMVVYWRQVTRSKSSVLFFLTTLLFAWAAYSNLVHSPGHGAGPDLIKVSSLARNFEPMIHYSENGVMHVQEIQESGVAVWDLGESVARSNMTSAPIITGELDNLGNSLKGLALGMTRFFASIDGDVDGILVVMEWARRELAQASQRIPSKLSSAVENLSTFAHAIGGPRTSSYLRTLFGQTESQLTEATLSRTFYEFLNVLEESIHNEISHSTALYALFEDADRQFRNLQRSVSRELDTQGALRDAELATLWAKLLGPNTRRTRRYEENQKLLQSVHERTVQNKRILVEHNGRLLALRANLETLRKKLVSPLVRRENISTATISEQIGGIEGTMEYLVGARAKQRSVKMEKLYGAGNRHVGGGQGVGIDGR